MKLSASLSRSSSSRQLLAITAITLASFMLVFLSPPATAQLQFDRNWWKTTIIYQIYPRSFADSDGDGIGDLRGITSHLDHIASLGSHMAIWISPFYESPQDDMGYDVSNFTRVDPIFGTNDDFDALIQAAHARNIRVIMDIVPSHTSYKCEWFEKSRHRIGQYSDYYVWHAGNPATYNNITQRNGPPNNWVSVFGGSMWQFDDVRQEYYLHQFLKEQPDLNYRSTLVHAEMQNILKFWLDKGVDGFRIDAFAHVYEAEPFLDNDEPLLNTTLARSQPDWHESYDHTKTKHQVGNFMLLQEWRQMVQEYTVDNNRDHILANLCATRSFMVSEVYGDTIEQSMNYDTFKGVKGADFNYNFNLVNVTNETSGYDIESAVDVWMQNLPATDGWPNWVLGNHDRWRIASRVGDTNGNLVDGYNMLLLLLPGTPTTYYGEVIGMTNNFNITLAQVRDKNALTPAHLPLWQSQTRDYERTPMQWTSQLPFAGFSSPSANSSLPWLPVNSDAITGNISVAAQNSTPKSHLNFYRQLVQLRNRPPFTMSKSMQTALVTPTLYSFIRRDENSTFLVAIDIRNNNNGMLNSNDQISYNFSQILADNNISLSAYSGRLVLHNFKEEQNSTNNSSSLLLQQQQNQNNSLSLFIEEVAADSSGGGGNNLWSWWLSGIPLAPGECFVAEFSAKSATPEETISSLSASSVASASTTTAAITTTATETANNNNNPTTTA